MALHKARVGLLILLLILVFGFLALTLPSVKAQSTSITKLQAPSTALVGTAVTIIVAAKYDLGSSGYGVSIGISSLDASYWEGWRVWAPGSVQSSQYTCPTLAPQSTEAAFCNYVPNSRSGSDVVTFQLYLNTVRTYRLEASVQLYQSNDRFIADVSTFQDFSIVVSSPANPVGNVIYGYSGGLPPDGAISSVAFLRQDNNLVTQFQVRGSISNDYGYVIEIKASSFEPYGEYVIALNCDDSHQNGCNLGAFFYNINWKAIILSINDSTVSGSTWTASVPLLWINGLTHFWAYAETGGGSLWPMDVAPPGPLGYAPSAEIILPASSTASTTTQASTTPTLVSTYSSVNYTPTSYSTSSSQIPLLSQPATNSQPTSNMPQLTLVVAVVVVVALAGLILYSRLGKHSKILQAKEVESEKTKGTTMFCNQCGAKITRDSKFCKECGAKVSE